jgi:hypothetical protein
MMNRIDVSGVLKTSVCDLYSNLVTRPTGRCSARGDRAPA